MSEEIISQERIEEFLHGSDPEKYIVGVEYDYKSNSIFKIIQDPEKGKVIKQDTLVPFLWVGDLTGLNFYQDNKNLQKRKMGEHGIMITPLKTHGDKRLENGLRYMVKSLKSYQNLMSFFKQGGIDPWNEKYRPYFQILNPVEQYLVQKKKRLFKGLEEYEDVHRFVFDIETTGLDPETDEIFLIGIKDNRGFKKVISAFGENGEKNCIEEFFTTIKDILPTIIGGYNSADFDFPFIMKRAEKNGVDVKAYTQILSLDGIKLKDGVLKLANEIEGYNQFVLFGFNIIDISHGVRRAQAINSEIKSWSLKYITKFIEKEKPNRIYVDGEKIYKTYQENESYYVNPKSGGFKKIGDPGTENLLEKYPGKFEVWTGRKIVEQYLDDDLYETMVVDDSFSQSTFLLAKNVPTTYERIATMGTATLWKLMMLAWSYENDLAIPEKTDKRKFVGGLSRLLNVGYAKDIVKFDYSSLYPSIQLVYDIFPECDVMGVQKAMLKYFRNIRIKYKNLTIQYEKTDPALSEKYDRKQLPIKIFINAYFGSLSAPMVFNWGDIDKGEAVTSIGRQSLRMMIMFFLKKGYKPLVMDTDGVNFEIPPEAKTHKYIGKGLNDLVEKGKEYEGVQADTAEFNDIFMRGEMGLDIDYMAPSCINVSRKNYIIKLIKKGKEKIKLTGNTIKSKKLAQYIVEFLDEGFHHLLNGEGKEFLDLYYQYIYKIENKEIPLAKIANKARVKQTIDQYKKHIKKRTKAGNLMARQAHMELIMMNDYHASLGETIYYVNNGRNKSAGDVKKVTKFLDKWTRKELHEYEVNNGKPPERKKETNIEINCYQIPESDIVNHPEKTGDYNVPLYISKFNKAIAPLLVVFNPEIREDILVTDYEHRQYFTESQCELDSGNPLKPEGQDDFNEVMTLSDMEIEFWNRVGWDPYMMYLEDSIKHVDQKWVELNRNLVKERSKGSDDKPDDVIKTDGRDFATEADDMSI